MKKGFLLITFAFILSAAACSKNEVIDFCEGVDPEGNGAECGKEFTTGDLNGVLTAREPFETESITVKILRVEKDTAKPEKNMVISVDRDKRKAGFDLSFYNAGNYTVEAWKDSVKIGEGKVTIRDTY